MAKGNGEKSPTPALRAAPSPKWGGMVTIDGDRSPTPALRAAPSPKWGGIVTIDG